MITQVLGVVVLLVCTIGVAATQSDHQLELQVVDEQGKAVANADVSILYWSPERNGPQTLDLKTDDEGCLKKEFSEKQIRNIHIQVVAEDMVGFKMTSSVWDDDPLEFPLQKTITLETGVLVQAKVVDRQDRPIAGATVRVSLLAQGVARPDWNAERFRYGNKTSDDTGQFEIRMTSDPNLQARLVIDHPDYLGPVMVSQGDFVGEEIRLPRAASITGRVVDQNGRPVTGATLRFGNYVWADHVPFAKSDDEGNFVLMGCWPGTAALTVQADGFSPQTRDVETSFERTGKVDFQLTPAASVLSGRVVDSAGNPVSNVLVRAAGWNDRKILHWKTRTDKDGSFAWNNPPVDPIELMFFTDDYLIAKQTFSPGADGSKEVVLWPVLELTGRVLDSETGEPVDKAFMIESSVDENGDEFPRDRHYFDKEFRIRISECDQLVRLWVGARGYERFDLQPLTRESGKQNLDFKLVATDKTWDELQWNKIEGQIDKSQFTMDVAATLAEMRDLGAEIEYRPKPTPVFRVKLIDEWEIQSAMHGVPNIEHKPDRKKWQGELADLKLLSVLEEVELHLDGLECNVALLQKIGEIESVKAIHFDCIWRLEDDEFGNFEQLTSPETIRIENNWQQFPEQGIKALIQLPNLYQLRLERCDESGNTVETLVEELPNFKALRSLDLDSATPANIAEQVNKLESLKSLSLSRAVGNDEFIRQFGDKPQFQKLELYGLGITDYGLASIIEQFPNLENLTLYHTSITDRGVELLARRRLPKLKTLRIGAWERPALVDLQRSHPFCDIDLVYSFRTGSMAISFSLREYEKVAE